MSGFSIFAVDYLKRRFVRALLYAVYYCGSWRIFQVNPVSFWSFSFTSCRRELGMGRMSFLPSVSAL